MKITLPHIHKWEPWEKVSTGEFEETRGMYIYYIFQKRQCIKCKKYEVNITYPKTPLHYK